MQDLVFLTDRFDGHGAGAGIGPQDAPDFVSQDQVPGPSHSHVRLGVGVSYKELDGMISKKTTLGIDLPHSKFYGIHRVCAIQSPGSSDGQINSEMIRLCYHNAV